MSGPDDRKVWISNAEEEQQGSFCDSKSGYEYHNRSNFDTETAIRDAIERDEEVIVVDDRDEPEQRCNLLFVEEDGQGLDMPRLYEPGR